MRTRRRRKRECHPRCAETSPRRGDVDFSRSLPRKDMGCPTKGFLLFWKRKTFWSYVHLTNGWEVFAFGVPFLFQVCNCLKNLCFSWRLGVLPLMHLAQGAWLNVGPGGGQLGWPAISRASSMPWRKILGTDAIGQCREFDTLYLGMMYPNQEFVFLGACCFNRSEMTVKVGPLKQVHKD